MLTFFNSEEGYIEPIIDNEGGENRITGFEYTYQYKDHLGNIRLSYQDIDGDGQIEPSTEIKEENHYYPFGLKHKGYNNQIIGRDHQYGYNGKEESYELGLEWLDLGARNHDPALGRFMNIDLLTEEYNYQSVYAMAENNPVFYIDFNGEGTSQNFDDYGIDEKTGKITLIEKTDDKTDTLYAGSGEGESFVKDESKGSVTVSQHEDGSSIISDLSDKNTDTQIWPNGEDSTKEVDVNITHTDGKSKDEVFDVFKFVADNSNVEWSLHKFSVVDGTSNYQIGTYHLNNLSPGFFNQGVGRLLGSVHSHPNQKTSKERKESLFGDFAAGLNHLNLHGKNVPYLIYFPSTGRSSRILKHENKLLEKSQVRTKHNIKKIKF